MGRGLWFVLGAGVGVYATIRGRRELKKLTPERIGVMVGRQLVDSRERMGRFVRGARVGVGERLDEKRRLDELTIHQPYTPAVDAGQPLGRAPRRVRN
ncbi:DUF6167 family protein [Propioniferax innocua]|uniref:Secreted protein n=1 Tax=Propioniferax innocua TaxID=1753 RepID=A0A542ZQ74_9ACTN|nr:DUF6167 family protein [Propioniferax innocua]TQL62513.1 hypothetical protein FB460_0291 [Propioniferax innocua]